MRLRNCWLSLLLLVLPSAAWANCSFLSGSGVSVLSIPLPASLGAVRDAPVGAELWNSGWRSAPGVRITCSGTGYGSGVLGTGIGAAVPGFTNAQGKPYVYATNVPGVGISVYFTETSSGAGDYNNAPPLTARSSSWIPAAGTYDWSQGLSWWVRLVKTGPVSTGGKVQVTGTSTAGVHNLVIARLNLTGTPTVAAKACEVGVDSKNILVTLPAVARTDFQDGMTMLPDSSKGRAFNIDLLCDAGVAVHYRIDGTQASTAGDVLANAVGPGMATGVGVQLFRGDTGSTTVQPLGTKLLHATATADGQSLGIPLAARYYQTTPLASDVTPGKVSATATFTLSYE